MVEIPENKKSFDASDISRMVESMCAHIVEIIEKQHGEGNYSDEKASVYSGGCPEEVVEKVGKMFAEKGWFVYREKDSIVGGYVRLCVYGNDRWPDYDRMVEENGKKERPEPMWCLKIRA